MKLTFKINILFTGIVCCILFGMAFLVFNLSRGNVRNDFRARIKNRAERADYLYRFFRNDTTNLLKSLDANSPSVLFNRSVAMYDTNFSEIYEFHEPDAKKVKVDTAWLSEAKQKGEVYINIGKKEAGLFYFNESGIVMVSAEDVSGKSYINNLRQIFFIYFPLAMIITLLIGYLFSRSIVRPIKQTIHDVKLITSQNLSHRLFAGKGKDELAQLNETFNSLLNRLEESFAMEKRFITNASHELSTPLTSISSQIEVALLKDRDSAAYKDVLSSVLKDAKVLHQLTRNLLEIAKTGSNGAISLEKLRVDEILIKAHSDVLYQNHSYKVELDFTELPEEENQCMVFGNSSLLYSAFKNLIENACKYSPDSRMKVELLFRQREIVIHFINKSADFTPGEMDKLFEPFYRGSNAGDKPGVGLGLTLSRRIIGLHKGVLLMESLTDNRTMISIVLPSLAK